jgi:hypothetical protein
MDLLRGSGVPALLLLLFLLPLLLLLMLLLLLFTPSKNAVGLVS